MEVVTLSEESLFKNLSNRLNCINKSHAKIFTKLKKNSTTCFTFTADSSVG